MQKALENALSDLFLTGTAKVKGGLKNATYTFNETLLTNMAKKKALKEIFDHSIYHSIQSTFFMNALTRPPLASLQFTRTVAQFITIRMDEIDD